MINSTVAPSSLNLTYKILLVIACVGFTLAVPAALDAAIVFGSWTGAALLARLAFICSPIFAFLCIAIATRAESAGSTVKAIAALAVVVLPLIGLVGLFIFHVATS